MNGVSIIEGKENVYGFLDPAYTNPIGAKENETQSYITTTLKKRGKRNLFMHLLMSKFNYICRQLSLFHVLNIYSLFSWMI